MTDHHKLKECFSLFSTGVMIATTKYQGENCGLTINSFSSVSLEPPLALFAIGNESYNLNAFKNSDSYILNILSQSQLDLAKDFSSHDHNNKWQDNNYTTSANENPIFEGSIGYIECKHHEIVKAGDHHIFIGQVTDFAKLKDEDALLYCKGQFIAA
jgi:flavin reductase (DIM6/NTAB) family NADH-FMN oxidoreductase RutF